MLFGKAVLLKFILILVLSWIWWETIRSGILQCGNLVGIMVIGMKIK